MKNKSEEKETKKIAVVGLGTGLTAVWAMENQGNFQVTGFDSGSSPGGHINSFSLQGRGKDGDLMAPVIVEGGAEFIGPPEKYPHVHALFEHLGVELKPYQLNMEFHNHQKKDKLVLPPAYFTSDGIGAQRSGCFPFLTSFFRKGQSQKKLTIDTHSLLCHFDDMLKMKSVIDDAEDLEPGVRKAKKQAVKIQQAKDKTLPPEKMKTLEQFVNAFIDGDKSKQDFADQFLYPLIAAGWGVSVDTIKTFGAHYAMNYLKAGDTWYDAPEGLSSYIDAMREQCGKTRFELDCTIKQLIPVAVDGQTKYQLLTQDDRLIMDDHGEPMLYDDVMLTSPAYITNELLADIEDKTIQDLREKLKAVEYYDTTVVFHQDKRYESEVGAVVHTRYDGERAANTMCKKWKFQEGDTPIMKTWVLPGQPMPKNVLVVKQYRHPVMNQAYYEAQQALHHTQGQAGLWFGGILGGNSDAHESGISVALQVAATLCQRERCLEVNERLKLFPDVIKSVQPGAPCDLVCGVDHDEQSEGSSLAMSPMG
ncbi:FAD-dependent oxidoreductase [Legionella spiritensis]|uniref:Amine oxidase, flavin containing n=1 Tax=Legionella spiritensis TaxID=452 RepID=A0A0W0YXL5_LEGSP|nr:FAD-dependent oxidoreductase [Legionella spiritensis]KTD61563.1 amine oxidase, flavin containing [Legionella spiritensis]SNV32463.1 amine oxidase, flavin containing [Legionella spiritensis]